MTTFRAARGTRDLLPTETPRWTALERLADDLGTRYGYRRIETPMIEQTAVFERGVGEVTDIVEKELFRIAPRTEEAESWSLRPEPTAGIVRAYVQHGMQTWPQPVKLAMTGPMFRYDRPQAGRYRQFWQFDIEAIGDAGPAIDAEIIELGTRFYRDAGLSGVEVLLNSIGDPACRPAYVAELTAWYRARAGRLPSLERDRLERNVLRLLDSKDPEMVALNADAPRITERLCAACAAHFAAVQEHLHVLGVPFRLEPGLVRGLDYYTRTAFEFYVGGREGQQQALGGGGRYDGLVELLGGRPTPGIGFGIGLDRLLLALDEQGVDPVPEVAPVAVVVGADPDDTVGRLRIATELRAAGIPARAELGRRKLGKQLESAARDQAHFAVILGDELAGGDVQVRDLPAGSQKVVPVVDLAREVVRAHGAHRHGLPEDRAGSDPEGAARG
ncbi:MAG: histidine--tRNA ligase [Candidatus Limnocylindria bacterium]